MGPAEKPLAETLHTDKKNAVNVIVNDNALLTVLGMDCVAFNIDVDFHYSSFILFNHEVFDLGSS